MIQADLSTFNSGCPQQKQPGKLDKLHHVEHCLWKLTEFLNPYLPLANTNVTDFITDNQWKNYLPENIQQELLELTEDQLLKLPHLNKELNFSENYSSTAGNEKSQAVGEYSCTWRHKTLSHLLRDADYYSLQSMNILTNISDLKQKLHLNLETDLFLTTFMSEKKSHEVKVMSKLCDALCKQFAIQTVVDLGSGKGYLGVQLAENYQLRVIGIDASLIHTLGARKRASILKKQQPKSIKKKPQKISNTEQSFLTRKDFHENTGLNKTNLSNDNENLSEHLTNKPEDSFPSQENSNNGFYLPTAAFVDNNTDIIQLLSNEVDVSHLNGKLQVLVTGLHTCGNLCPSALQFFSGNPAAWVLCSVACCYHLLDEENISTDDFQSGTPSGFPMSSFLRKRKFKLGRGARNLASQSISRNMSSGQLQGHSLFQRALLQKIIQETVDPEFHKPTEASSKLRKLGSKCSTFLEYVKKAFIKLGFSSDHICEQVISGFITRYEDEKKKLAAFFQLKTVLAPIIEAIIILDRLYFLLEQDTVSDAYICQLFDPLISPRCYAIIAYK